MKKELTLKGKELVIALEKAVSEGRLVSSKHPYHDITIYKYSRETQYNQDWDEITLNARGLVVHNETGKILARPFPKFFNYEEKKTNMTEEFEVFEKMDGSLIIAFLYGNQLITATQGSFTSTQAINASKLLKTNYWMRPGISYLFEYVSPENRIVVEYLEEKLVFLAMLDSYTGDEYSYLTVKKYAEEFGIEPVKNYQHNGKIGDLNKSLSLLKRKVNKYGKDGNSEGVVLKFSSGDRMKIKAEEYVRLHGVLTGFSTKRVWEFLKEGKSTLDLIELVPDEYYEKLREIERELRVDFIIKEETVGKTLDIFMYGKSNVTQKEFALWVLKQDKWKQPILFKMYNGKDYTQDIWKLVKPKFEKI